TEVGRPQGRGPSRAGAARPAQGARPVRQPASRLDRAAARGRVDAQARGARGRRPDRRARAHRRHLLRAAERAAGAGARAAGGGRPAHREGVDAVVSGEAETARLMPAAFALARQRRKRPASGDKATVLSSPRLWREVAHEVAREYPDVAYEDVLVDAMAMHLIRRPRDFDVIATENLFGDILTDEASMLAGSMGMLPSASLAGAPVPRPRCARL